MNSPDTIIDLFVAIEFVFKSPMTVAPREKYIIQVILFCRTDDLPRIGCFKINLSRKAVCHQFAEIKRAINPQLA